MRVNEDSILGISLGTRTIGIAIMKGRVLLDWDIKEFKEKWSRHKLKIILKVIDGYIDGHQISILALKTPSACRSSQELQNLADELIHMVEDKGITLISASNDALKQYCSQSNKRELASYVAYSYPELSKLYSKAKHQRNSYHIKVFEAVMIAEMVSNR